MYVLRTFLPPLGDCAVAPVLLRTNVMYVFYVHTWKAISKAKLAFCITAQTVAVMPPKVACTQILADWRKYLDEHQAIPLENGGAGHALAMATRRKMVAGHFSRAETRELQRLRATVFPEPVEQADKAIPCSSSSQLNRKEPAGEVGVGQTLTFCHTRSYSWILLLQIS